MPDRNPSQWENRILTGIFLVALLAHGWLVTRNWTAGFMPGHEFRQAQTAITTYYIDQQDNFSLLYETPIVGKPWAAILLEVPFYEWSVVLLSRETGQPHYLAARTVSLTCFYLMLPALYLLLGRFALSRPRRLLVLALVLTCPVYIFYTRAFLMESMELMCCAWFLFGYVGMMDRRRWPWFVLATAAGTGAALIKSATLAVWLLPAAGYGAWLLWRDLRARSGWSALLPTVFWGLAGVVVPLGALHLWIRLTDPIKALHASGWIFTSKNLAQDNWGLVDVAARFSSQLWSTLAERWREAIMPPGLILAGLVSGLVFLPQVRRPVLALAAVFFLAQLLFPFAYAYQDYYFYACAAFLAGAFGFMLHGLLDSRLPRWLCCLVLAIPFGAQLNTYWRGYYPYQLVPSNGGFPFTAALRDHTPGESVIIVAGADWAAIVPLYAQRKALMIRNGLVADSAYLNRAFAELADEDVSALVLLHDQRGNRLVLDLAVARFGLDPAPTFSHEIADVYCRERYRERVMKGLKDNGNYGSLVPGPDRPSSSWSKEAFPITPRAARTAFGVVSPAPFRAQFTYPCWPFGVDGEAALNAHPDSDLWLHAPAGATRIEWDFGIVADAYERAGDRTDGIEFCITGRPPGGAERVIFKRFLDPVGQPADRGRQRAVIPYQPVPGEILHFTSRPGPGYAYDWGYWTRIDVK